MFGIQRTTIRNLIVLSVFILFSCRTASYAQASLGTIHGITRDISGQPLPAVEVVVDPISRENVPSGSDWSPLTTTTGSDGTFVVDNLTPGHYQLMASKEGFEAAPPKTVEVAAGGSLNSDLFLAPVKPPVVGPAAAVVPSRYPLPLTGDFWTRLGRAYLNDWFAPPSTDPVPSRRAGMWDAPTNGPPFPFADWPYGGSVVIGAPWTQSSPFMQGLWSGPNGQAWKNSGIQIYGWMDVGATFGTSQGVRNPDLKFANFPMAYAEVPNSIQPDQEVIYIERQPNTVQTDHIDWGFRLTALWGLDYRFTTSQGIFSQQLINKNEEYGFDPVMAYVDLYVPQVGEGMDVRIGRYVSLPDIEAQLAPNNYTYTHSLLYAFDCYTQSGVNATVRLSSHWLVQAGLSGGCDTALWTSQAKLTGNACVQYQWRGGADDLYLCDNTINDGHYAYNNMVAYYATWFHKFGKTWHTGTEAWYQYMKDVPNTLNPAAASLFEPNAAFGAVCNTATELTCSAPEKAIVNYVEKQVGPHNYLSIRNEFFDDMRGQRTGFRTNYSEHTVGWGRWIGTTVLFRPEIRFEHSYEEPAYQNGTRKSQFTVSSDVIYFF